MLMFYRIVTSVFRYAGIGLIIVLSAILSIFSMIINPSGNLSFLILKKAAQLILYISGVRIYHEGLFNICINKTVIIAVNHSSYYDIPILYSAIPVPIAWLAKKELFSIPFLGWLMKANRFVSIDRGNGRDALKRLKITIEKIRNGNSIVIFPEGTRTIDGNLQSFKKLIFRLSLETAVPIIPVYIEGSFDILKPGGFIINPGKVYIGVGEEILTSKYQKNKVLDLMNDLKDTMIRLRNEIQRKN